MKKRTFSYSRTSAAVLIIAIIACLAAWLPSSVARPKDDKPTKVKQEKAAEAQKAPDATASQDAMDSQSDEGRLVQLLINDGLVNQVKGFVVEKKQSSLFINGEKQADEVAKKYLSTMTQENMRVQVFSFSERLNMHPDASFLQILLPVSLESPCVDVKSKRKPGC